MKVTLSRKIEPDLRVIAQYIARHNPVRAASFVDEIRSEFEIIARSPEIYRLRPDLGHNLRSAPKGEYLILYKIEGDTVRIRRIVHGARDLHQLPL